MSPASTAAKPPVYVSNPMFKGLIIINAVLCIVTLGVMVWAVSDPADPMPKGKERLYNTCEHVFTLTAGAFIGLLGGRAAGVDQRSIG